MYQVHVLCYFVYRFLFFSGELEAIYSCEIFYARGASIRSQRRRAPNNTAVVVRVFYQMELVLKVVALLRAY